MMTERTQAMPATHQRSRAARIVGGFGLVVVTALLSACTGGSSSTEAPSASTSPVETAASGAVADYRSPKSHCTAEWNPDDTANVRLYNQVKTPGVKNFQLASSQDDNAILLQSYDKYWENGAASEGRYSCQRVPDLVRNNDQQTYYYSDGAVWGGHPGWWGHTKSVSWNESPKGWVKFKCNGKVSTAASTESIKVGEGCADSKLATGYVEAPWDTKSSGNSLTNKPGCTTTNQLIGCWTDSGHTGDLDGDFYFNTTAWSAPMRLQLTADVQVDSEGNYVVWEITNAEVADAAWSSEGTPQGQEVKRGSSLYVGAYAVARNGSHTVNLTLKPKALVDADGNRLACRKDGQVRACRPVDRTESIESISVWRKGDISSIAVDAANGLATYTTKQGVDLAKGDRVEITGASNSANDGTFDVVRATGTSFTVKNPEAVKQATAAGTVTKATGLTATYTTSASHELIVGDRVEITGASDAANNGTFTITKTTGTTFTVGNKRAVDQEGAGGTVKFLGDPSPNLGRDHVLTVAATVKIDEAGSQKAPKVTPTIECSTNFRTIGTKNLELSCAKAGSPFEFGGAWTVTIKN
jgi:hypothetical protein